jgi:hypothetical protein
MKKFLYVAVMTGVITVMMFSLSGCSKGLYAETEKDGISVEVKIDTEKNKPGNTVYHIYSTFRNASDVEVMYIKYKLRFLDDKGEELFVMHPAWQGQDKPLISDETGKDEIHIQDPRQADRIEVEIVEVKDVKAIAPVHVPAYGEYLYEALNNENLNRIREVHPVNIRILIDHMGARNVADVSDEKTINALVEAFCKVRIGNDGGMWVTDNYNGIEFTFADGSKYYLSLNLVNLEYSVNGVEHVYELEDFKEFWLMCKRLTGEINY